MKLDTIAKKIIYWESRLVVLLLCVLCVVLIALYISFGMEKAKQVNLPLEPSVVETPVESPSNTRGSALSVDEKKAILAGVARSSTNTPQIEDKQHILDSVKYSTGSTTQEISEDKKKAILDQLSQSKSNDVTTPVIASSSAQIQSP